MLFAIIADHFSIPRMMIFCYAMPALASGILLFAGSLPMAMLFAVCCGIPLGGRLALFPVALSYSFGPTHLAAIYGLNNSFFFLGIAFGPIIGGMIYDGTGQNTAAVYATAMVLFALSGCLIALMRRETSDGRSCGWRIANSSMISKA